MKLRRVQPLSQQEMEKLKSLRRTRKKRKIKITIVLPELMSAEDKKCRDLS